MATTSADAKRPASSRPGRAAARFFGGVQCVRQWIFLMVRVGFAMAGVVLLVSACSSAVSPGSATSSDAIGAYVQFTEDRFEADDLLDPLTKAAPGEASTPAGFIPGLRSTFVARDSAGVFGVQIIFQADVTQDDRQFLGKRARSLGLLLTWLGPADYWPGCEGEPDCFLVGDTPSLP